MGEAGTGHRARRGEVDREKMMKKFSARLALVVIVGAAIVALPSAPAMARTCPSPGTGNPGALNMVTASVSGLTNMGNSSPQGFAGMNLAIANSSC
jgi:hypothetical protein